MPSSDSSFEPSYSDALPGPPWSSSALPAAFAEPEVALPPPRRVRAKPGRGAKGAGCMVIFIVPHTVVGLGMLCYVLLLTLTWALGIQATARITDRTSSRGEDSTTYSLHYQYRVRSGQVFSDKQSVSFDDYNAFTPGQVVPAKSSPLIASKFSLLDVPGAGVKNVGYLWGMALFWNGIVSVFWLALVVAPLRAKKLVACGQPVWGRVSSKQIVKGSYSDNHYLHIVWPTASGEGRAKMTVPPDDYLAAREGEPVTVLADAHHPKRGVAYRYSDYYIDTQSL